MVACRYSDAHRYRQPSLKEEEQKIVWKEKEQAERFEHEASALDEMSSHIVSHKAARRSARDPGFDYRSLSNAVRTPTVCE